MNLYFMQLSLFVGVVAIFLFLGAFVLDEIYSISEEWSLLLGKLWAVTFVLSFVLLALAGT